MKNKVLEGAALGKAMVVTPVSLEDIDLAPGRDLLLAEAEPQPFADAIIELLDNPDKRAEMGMSARRAVAAHYAWEVMAERLWASYEAIKGCPRNSP
jgi:glycosyltransferase involved in cell wall biosynthesis